MWEYIIRGKLEGLKELYEVVAIVDVRCGCYYKMLHEVIDIVCGWLLIECQRNDGRQRKGKYILERSWKREIHGGFGGGGEGVEWEAVEYICFGEPIEKWRKISGSVIYYVGGMKEIKCE